MSCPYGLKQRGHAIMEFSPEELKSKIITPRGGGGFIAFLLKSRHLNLVLARLFAWIGRRKKNGPLRVSKGLVAVIAHGDVTDAFRRDSDFLIAPTNRARFEALKCPFVLCMDRSPELSLEHRAMYSALAGVDLIALRDAAAQDADAILDQAEGGRLDVVADYFWRINALTSQRLFGISNMDFDLFRLVARAMFYHIFFNDAGDKKVIERAVIAGDILKAWLMEEIGRRRAGGIFGDDFMGQLMRRSDVDDDMICRTLSATLVGSIDTVTGASSRLLVTLANNIPLRAQATASLHDSNKLTHYCMEGLRLWPHNPFLARKAGADTQIRATKIVAGQKLLLMTSAAMFDTAAFPDPRQMLADRPLASYLHFGLGIHACSGRALSELIMPMLIGKLLERNYRIDGAMKWAGPFPDSLMIRFHQPIERRAAA
jgi:cytochrome P450